MRNKSVEMIGATLAVGAILSAFFGYNSHKNERKSVRCGLAHAECIEYGNFDGYSDAIFDENAVSTANTPAEGTKKQAPLQLFTNGKSAYVMEASSGIAVFEKEGTKRLPIASMCKIMTLLLAFESIDEGILSMDEEITVSQNAADMGGSQVFLEANAKYRVSELIKSIVVCSANDSCVALAERIAGSDSLFVDKMNEKARALGCENTLFANCTGLPKEPQYSCAKDVAKMFAELIKHEEYFTFSKIWLDRFLHPQGRTTEITNTNRLVKFYNGCDGGKTGFTNEAGFCLAATAKRENMRLISVVIGEQDSKTRFKEMSESFDYTFANYTMQKVVDADANLDEKVAVCGGKTKSVSIQPARNGYIFVKRGEKADYQTQVILESGISAPFEKGAKVGEIRIYRQGVACDNIPLVVTESVDKATYGDTLKDVAGRWNLNGK